MVHCITGEQAIPAELAEHLHLHQRVDVAEKHVIGVAVGLRKARDKVREHVQT
jgi:hypothetical protein